MKGLSEDELKKKQEDLDTATIIEYQEKGCPNIIQAKFLKEVARLTMSEDIPALYSLLPAVKEMKTVAWVRTFGFCIAYLRRYKMDNTLKTLRIEGATIPKDTGFSRSSDLDKYFKRLKFVSLRLSGMPFADRVTEHKLLYEEKINKIAEKNEKKTSKKKATI